MPHRYFTREIVEGRALLRGEEARHLVKVMRAKPGEALLLCDGEGLEYEGVLTAASPELAQIEVGPARPSRAEPEQEATLFVGYPKGGKLEEIIQHGVELGAARIIPFFSRYCVAAPRNEEKKNERYNRIAFEAAKQAGRGRIPAVEPPLPNFAAVAAALSGYDRALFFYEHGGMPLSTALQGLEGPGKRLALITGAEGGFSAEEAAAAAAAGAVTVGLGPRILRCETAPQAALAAVLALLGQLE